MAFDGNGTFKRLFSWRDDRDSGIKILAERMDAEFDGVAEAVNMIVGNEIPAKGVYKALVGTSALPGYAFGTSLGTGLYLDESGDIGFSKAGVPQVTVPEILEYDTRIAAETARIGATETAIAAANGRIDDVESNAVAVEARVASVESLGVQGFRAAAGGPALLATTASIMLLGEQTIDGELTSGSRVLVKDQAAPEENGIYVSGAGVWARSSDMDDPAEVAQTSVSVTGGATNAGFQFATYSEVTTLGTDAVEWIVFKNDSGVQGQLNTLSDDQSKIILNRHIHSKSDVRPASGERDALVSSARALAAGHSGWNANSIIYCDPNATGLADGSSWADAFTAMSSALAAVRAGGRLYTNAPASAPFSPQLASSVPSGVRWISDEGPDGVTWVDGRIYGVWTDIAGVWNTPAMEEPDHVVYDLRQDDTAGTVTGVNLDQKEIKDAIVKSGRAPDDLRAWHGFLRKSGSATTSPAEGEWSYLGGLIYINPPGTPVKADVDAKAAWTDGANLVQLSGPTYSHLFHEGDLRTICSPSASAAKGYGVRLVSAKNCTIADLTAHMAGYHAAGAAGASQDGNTFVGCTAVGLSASDSGVGAANPFVFYSDDKDYEDAGHLGLDLAFIGFPALDSAGAPLTDEYTPVLGLSHTDGTTTMKGIRWDKCLCIDFIGQLEAKHGITIAYQFSSFSGTNYPTPDIADAGVWPVSVWDSTVMGKAASLVEGIEYRSPYIDRLGYGDATDIPVNMAAPIGNDANVVRAFGGVWNTGPCLAALSSHAANDATRFEGVSINIGTTGARPTLFRCISATTTIEMKGCSVTSDDTTATVITANPTAWGSGGANVVNLMDSLGGNLFGEGMTGVRHTNAAVVPLSVPELLALIDPEGRDIAGVSL